MIAAFTAGTGSLTATGAAMFAASVVLVLFSGLGLALGLLRDRAALLAGGSAAAGAVALSLFDPLTVRAPAAVEALRFATVVFALLLHAGLVVGAARTLLRPGPAMPPPPRWPVVVALAMLVAAAAFDAALSARASPPIVSIYLIAVPASSLLTIGACLLAFVRRHDAAERAQRRSLESALKFRHVYYTVPVGLVSVAPDGQVLRWNDVAAQFFPHALVAGRVNMLPTVLGAEHAAALLEQASADKPYRTELRYDDARGAMPRVLSLEARRAAESVEITLTDISERSALMHTLENMAYHDFLTDVLNRRGLERELDRLAAAAGALPFSLIYVDLDRFKAINDVYGHATGDRIVIEVAKRLRQHVPSGASVGRVGGDEFVAVLPGMRLSAAKAEAVALMKALTDDSYPVDGLVLDIEASLGVIEAARGASTRELLAYADEACASSKKNGGGRITALESSDELLSNYRAELRFSTQLRSGLATERLRIHAQPIVPLQADSGTLCYEVLLRAIGDKGVPEPPARLIAAAERHGGMSAIDRFVLQTTLSHLSEHPAHLAELGFVCVNLSGVSLNDERFRRDATAMLGAHPDAAKKLCLEITESVALLDVNTTRRFVDQMQRIGVRIALDDFGAGYTSFAYLKDIPASLIKIDGQFIVDLSRNVKHQGIIRAMEQLARELGMRCVAEWVEDVPTLARLLQIGIDYAQGFALSKSRPLEHWLTARPDLAPLDSARSQLIAEAIGAPQLREQIARRPGGVDAAQFASPRRLDVEDPS